MINGTKEVDTLQEVCWYLKENITITGILNGDHPNVQFINEKGKVKVVRELGKGNTDVVNEGQVSEQTDVQVDTTSQNNTEGALALNAELVQQDHTNEEVTGQPAEGEQEAVDNQEAELSPEEVTKQEVLASLPAFQDLEELKEFIKDIDTPTLEFIATTLGCEWKKDDNKPIERMRMAMSLHRYFFPELFKANEEGKKKKAKYADMSTDDLFGIAADNNIDVQVSDHEAINRMRVIMALKGAGLLPQ